MMDRRQFLSGAPAILAQGSRRPKNILFLIGDDHGRHTGAYGDAQARTPNLDRLAGEGVRFANAFGATASCSASRSVMLSGLQNHANGQYGHEHGEHHFSYLPFVRPAPALLKDAGYLSGIVGKFHVGPASAFGWDFTAGGGRDGQAMAESARKFIQGAGSKPWYLHAGYTDPHRGRAAGTDEFGNKDYPGIRRTPFDPAKIRVPAFLPDLAEVRQDVAQYYEATNRLDQGIGMMLDVLQASGQYDNTLILYAGDNGMPFPNAKTTAYDAGLHLPFILRLPEQARRGLVNNAMVSFVDILPTFLEWAGVRGPEYPLHGRSVLPILERENPAGWEEIHFSHTFHEITMYYPMRGMRTRRFKYIRNLFPELEFPFASDLWASPAWQAILKQGEQGKVGRRPVRDYLHRAPEELYDIGQDPDEVNNLAASAEHRGTLEKMRLQVAEYRRKTKDPWLINDNYRRKA
ncbi:MAG: sulfatase [Acidobacteria bacterium]|nr:sulfatase [Acidobacteriota bacterium]